MNPFKWYRNWRIRRTEEHIAFLEKYCDSFHDEHGSVRYDIAYHHDLFEKRAEVAQLRKRLYNLIEF